MDMSLVHPAQARVFLLDWDGILADTRLDFSHLRNKYFGGNTVPLFETAKALPEPDRSLVLAEIEKVELEGADTASAMEGAHDLIAWLAEARRPWAVISRNSRESVFLAAQRCGITLPAVTLCREDPYVKPDARALKLAADRLGVNLADCVMVGDFIYDLEAAKNAGIPFVYVREKRGAEWESRADFHYASMTEFVEDLRAYGE
jgi:HAD superfamily hydrolase (TIGR01549 family)